jgi:hypothetical protein
MRDTRTPDEILPGLRVYVEPDIGEPDPFAGMLTPSRDHWYSFVHGEVMDLLERHDMNDEQKAREIMILVERERGRVVAEER